MMGCQKCHVVCGVLLLALGLLMLLQNLGIWNFWNIQWYTGVLIIFGVGSIAMTRCKDCRAMMGK